MLLECAALRWDEGRAVELPECIEVGNSEKVDGSIIWLHGLGADGHDFEGIVPQLTLSAGLNLRFIFPHAPVRPVTLNGGMAMRAWYDIFSLDRDGPVDEVGIRQSAGMLAALIKREHQRGVAYSGIVLAGFSQGGAIASHCALRFSEPLAGLMMLSTYLPLHSTLQEEVADSSEAQSRDLRILMAHGTFDPMLPIQMGSASRDRMQSLGYAVEWFEYPMQHAVCTEEIAEISRWLNECFENRDA